MPTVNQLLSEKLKLYELDSLFKEVRKVQRFTFKQAVDFYIAEKNRLEGEAFLTRGSLAATAVNRFEKRLTDVIEGNLGYRSEIRKYMTNFDKMDKLNIQVHKKLNKIDIKGVIKLATKQQRELVGGTVSEVMKNIKSFPKDMLGDGLRQQFTKPIKKVLYQNIMQGKSQTAAKKALHDYIIGDKGKIGQLERHSGQLARDTLSQYDGAVNDMVREEFDLNGFKYIGSLVRDSRPQCQRWVKMREIPMSILPAELANSANRGQIPGTTKDNFATYRGGYNCQHQAIAIRIDKKVLTK
jgi:hypothetical protein